MHGENTLLLFTNYVSLSWWLWNEELVQNAVVSTQFSTAVNWDLVREGGGFRNTEITAGIRHTQCNPSRSLLILLHLNYVISFDREGTYE